MITTDKEQTTTSQDTENQNNATEEKQNGKVISEWTSKEGQSHVIKLLPGTYTFHEEAAISSPSTFCLLKMISFG